MIVVGGGPAGVTLAKKLAELTDFRVLIVESGADNVGVAGELGQGAGGRRPACGLLRQPQPAPLRRHVQHLGGLVRGPRRASLLGNEWPFPYGELKGYYPEAARILNVPSIVHERPEAVLDGTEGSMVYRPWYFSSPVRFGWHGENTEGEAGRGGRKLGAGQHVGGPPAPPHRHATGQPGWRGRGRVAGSLGRRRRVVSGLRGLHRPRGRGHPERSSAAGLAGRSPPAGVGPLPRRSRPFVRLRPSRNRWGDSGELHGTLPCAWIGRPARRTRGARAWACPRPSATNDRSLSATVEIVEPSPVQTLLAGRRRPAFRANVRVRAEVAPIERNNVQLSSTAGGFPGPATRSRCHALRPCRCGGRFGTVQRPVGSRRHRPLPFPQPRNPASRTRAEFRWSMAEAT